MSISAEGQQGLQAANSGFWNAVNLGWNSIQNMKDKEWQAKFWKATYDRQLKDNLRYNTPSAQLARMKEAGLNANLMYGNGVGMQPFSFGATPGTIGSHGANATAGYDPLIAAQIRNIDADTENKKADTAKKESETTGQDLTNVALEITNKYLDERQQKELAEIDAKIDNLDAQSDTFVKQLDVLSAQEQEFLESAGLDKAQAEYVVEQKKFVKFYAALEARKVDLQEKDLQLKEVGLEITAQGVIIDAARLRLDGQHVILDGKRLSLEEFKAKAQADLQKAQGYFFQQQGDKVDHDIAQGYWNCVNGTVNSVGNILRLFKGSGSNSYWSQYMSK